MADLTKPVCMFTRAQLSDLQPKGALPKVDIPVTVEGYASRVAPIQCDPTPKPGVVLFRKFVLEHLGGGDSGICRGCQGQPAKSEHNEGRAWDWTVNVNSPADVARVEQLFAWLFAPGPNGEPHANFRRAGLRYIIWDRRIWSSSTQGWKKYTGKSAHRDHVHFTFSWPGARAETSFYRWLGATPVPPGPGPPGPALDTGFTPAQIAVALVIGVAVGWVGADLWTQRS